MNISKRISESADNDKSIVFDLKCNSFRQLTYSILIEFDFFFFEIDPFMNK